MHVCGNHLRYYASLSYKHSSGRHKHSSGRHKRSSGRSVSKAALHFRNLCVYAPITLQKKPSDLRHSCTANAFRKNVLNVGVIFFDVYHTCTIGPSCGRGRCGLIPRPSTPSIFSYVYCGQAYFERIIKYWWCRRPGNKAIIILNQSSSTSDMTTPILLYMGSVQLLPLNWIYSWCKVITRAILRLSKWYSLWTSMFCAGRGSSPPAPNPCAGSHEPLFWKSWL